MRSHLNSFSIVKPYLLALQEQLCEALQREEDNVSFIEDAWQHPYGGGGLTRVMSEGVVIEKAGVNFSHINGRQLPKAATTKRPELADAAFEAMGLSVVIHPVNPYAPTSHMNLRFIVVEKKIKESEWWFGGGFDLTPYYGFTEDCVHWHRMAKAACDPFGKEVYPTFKKNCDDYFFLPHRNEPRGIGGLFFDDVNTWGFERSFDFIKSVGEHYRKAYLPILARRKQTIFGQRERDFQRYRRGRYVEFNLLYDRGTLFGLQSGGRTESILMSLPPQVTWHYNWHPEVDSPEAQLYQEFLQRREWV